MVNRLTVEDVKNAAETLAQVSRLYEQDPDKSEWSRESLLAELSDISASLYQENLLDELIGKLIQAFAVDKGDYEELKKVLRTYEIDRNPYASTVTVRC